VSDALIVHRWASAIFEIARDSDAIVRVTGDLLEFAGTYEANPELRSALGGSLVSENVREAILTQLGYRMRIHEAVIKALRLLLRKGRLRALPKIARRLEELADEHEGVTRADVTSVQVLSEELQQKLRVEIEKVTSTKVILTLHRDPSLLGGIVTRIGDVVVDGSIQGKLRTLAESLVRS
jgi:F-type H+-transporting ATPase subunit delta